MSRARHSSLPLKQTATGQGFALKAGVKDLRAQFDAWRVKYERENARLREINTELLAACKEAENWLENHGADGAGSDVEEGLQFLRKTLGTAIANASGQ